MDGDGPARAGLMQRFPGVHFTGYRDNGMLARSYAGADVFVAGSAIFGSADYAATIRRMRAELK